MTLELIVSRSGREDVKARPHGKVVGRLSKTEQSGCFLSLTHALDGQSHSRCMDRHTGTPTRSHSLCVRACMISHTHAATLAHLLLILGDWFSFLGMLENPGTCWDVCIKMSITLMCMVLYAYIFMCWSVRVTISECHWFHKGAVQNDSPASLKLQPRGPLLSPCMKFVGHRTQIYKKRLLRP